MTDDTSTVEMASLTNRKHFTASDNVTLNVLSSNEKWEDIDHKMKIPRGTCKKALIFCCVLVVFVSLVLKFHTPKSVSVYSRIDAKAGDLLSMNVDPATSLLIKREIVDGVDLTLLFARYHDNSDELSVSGHQAELVVDSRKCLYPQLWVRFTGPIIIPLLLQQDSVDKRKGFEVWRTLENFQIPAAGEYQIEFLWRGCLKSVLEDDNYVFALKGKINIKGVVSPPASPPTNSSLFVDSNWIPTTGKSTPDDTRLPIYTWYPFREASKVEDAVWIYTKETVIAQDGTVLPEPNGYRKFEDLGNYELVCFMGNSTMEKIRDKFLTLLPLLFRRQRPFKFHMYPIAGLTKPDRHWPVDRKKALRKCKHILLSMDEVSADSPSNPLSQSQYKDQITTFINHLNKVIPDETFPIWVFTFNTHPASIEKESDNNCHSQFLPRTSDHPCNDVLHHIFANKNKKGGIEDLPNRIQLLDNSDLVLPLWPSLPQIETVLTIIALRVFVIVGLGVERWREIGQKGTDKGLQRDGKITPNFALFPYDGWSL